jgi:hypothetical protein
VRSPGLIVADLNAGLRAVNFSFLRPETWRAFRDQNAAASKRLPGTALIDKGDFDERRFSK